MEDLNKKIKELRSVLGMTQAQFAEKLELTQSNLSAIEGGKREVNLNIVMKIKEKFKISIEDFYTKIYIKLI
ncbi:helix-turn-helix domain-containing protein [Bacteroides faecis]|uniref:helix-turn-helix domain-containing protein n=1 Tax=Bacteroides faecis TaxID=674529 RepID=UPI002166AB74|nr:helix-turn-helix transcriptional regulator [Bacteroides faecis]MCS2936514.1 helix-turn-helix domain-containing protein [Bacteroides faecis]